MAQVDINRLLDAAQKGIDGYLKDAVNSGRIDQQLYRQAKENTFSNLKAWMEDEHFARISPSLREGLRRTIEGKKWEQLVNAYRQKAKFGTGGIRGMMGFDLESVELLKKEGLNAPILKGPSTINEIVLLLTSAGVAKFGREQNPPFSKVVIGYDSRVRGNDFAAIVAQLFLAYGYTVYFFDEPCPYPEVTFAIPCEGIKADVGILLSASHNDYRYNGYKLSCANGSQFDPEQRDEMYNKYIAKVVSSDIRLCPFEKAEPDKLVFLGGDSPVPGVNYYGRENRIINVHERHCNHVKQFLMIDDLAERQKRSKDPLRIGYCAYHGAGRRAVPRLLTDVGFRDIKVITVNGLNDLDGLFPSFENRAGMERQPDPGDQRAAETAVNAFKKQYGSLDQIDILIGTDPDADRCGVVVKVPPSQRHLYEGRDWMLLPADVMWALLLWYRFEREIEKHGSVRNAETKFVVLSHTTSEGITLLARKRGLGVITTWVGFAALSAAVRDVWERKPLKNLKEGRLKPGDALCDPFVKDSEGMDNGKRSFNVAAMEQSNGFSLLGGPPSDFRSLGTGGHVRDKDGTLAALLIAEIAAWAKENGTSLFELVDQRIHLDPDVGLFVTYYEPDPLDGEYPGIEGDRKKKSILLKAIQLYRAATSGNPVVIAGRKVTSATFYRTGKYDATYPPTDDFFFPDEGLRFYFGNPLNHATVRPSGTGNSLRFHVQLQTAASESNLIAKKQQLMSEAAAIVDDLRNKLEAPRN